MAFLTASMPPEFSMTCWMSWEVSSSFSSASLIPAQDSSFFRSGSRLLGSQPTWLTCLNPLGAPMSALESLLPFLLSFFLSFFPLLTKAGAGTGVTER